MRHFVQFHNPDVWGEALDLKSSFRVSTAKSVRRLPGQRVWLLSRTGKPWIYFVASTFVVTATETDRRRLFPNTVTGEQGQVLGPAARVDTTKWWRKLLDQTGSFLWGLTEIRDPGIIRGLEAVARRSEPSRTRNLLHRSKASHGKGRMRGARFGEADANRLVEAAAISFVRRHLRNRQWSVISVEKEARGFDLLCKKAGRVMHVEVKGVSGELSSFMVTANERRECGADPHWRAAIVTRATSSQPDLHLLTGPQLRHRYEFVPKDYYAIPR